jgi:hypothetical protein
VPSTADSASAKSAKKMRGRGQSRMLAAPIASANTKVVIATRNRLSPSTPSE